MSQSHIISVKILSVFCDRKSSFADCAPCAAATVIFWKSLERVTWSWSCDIKPHVAPVMRFKTFYCLDTEL